MIRHAAQAVPWAVIALGTGLVSLLLLIVERWPYELWPLQGAAVGVLAATTAWCFDEPGAAVVDTLPRHLGWRTAARCAGVFLIVAGWALTLAGTSDGYFGHTADVAWQGAAAALLTIAVVTVASHARSHHPRESRCGDGRAVGDVRGPGPADPESPTAVPVHAHRRLGH
jgi:hypothetical protein